MSNQSDLLRKITQIRPYIWSVPTGLFFALIIFGPLHPLPIQGFHDLDLIPFVDYIKQKENIIDYNRQLLLPRITKLINSNHFRYVRVNLNRPCKLWSCHDEKCSLEDCEVKIASFCPNQTIQIYDEELSFVNTKLDGGQLDLLIKPFECNDDDDYHSEFVDLHINPERYTGYKSESAHRVWRAIYEENCFLRESQQSQCYEHKLFYEAISGLHSSISIHLCAEYPSKTNSSEFVPNLKEFMRRFTYHNDYLENLFKLLRLELKALSMCETNLMKVKWPEAATKDAMHDLLKVARQIEDQDKSRLDNLSLKPSSELAFHFRNITSSIMDCVGCNKCKLWGKVQLRGLGAAFKVLTIGDIGKLNLNHQEIVSLINAIARLSNSIRQLETFRDMLEKEKTKISNIG